MSAETTTAKPLQPAAMHGKPTRETAGENVGGCNEMKPTADLEARIMNRLQTMNRGQTIEQLETYLGEPQSKILAVLMPLQRVGYVTMSKSGVWTLVRE